MYVRVPVTTSLRRDGSEQLVRTYNQTKDERAGEREREGGEGVCVCVCVCVLVIPYQS